MKIINDKHIIAERGKALYRKDDNTGPFVEVLLGLYAHNGVVRWETIEDFEERDIASNKTSTEEQ